MKFQDACEDYLLYVLHEQKLSKQTWYCYKANLAQYREWMKGQPDATPEGGDAPTIETALVQTLLRRYLYFLSGQNLRPRSIRGRFHAIRGLCRYLVVVGALSESPAEKVRLPKKDAAQRLIASDEELKALLAACERIRREKDRVQSRAILHVLIFCGLRMEELTNLKPDDIHLSAETLTVAHGKGDKARTLHPSQETLSALADWLAIRPACEHPYLWACGPKKRMSDDSIRTVLEEVKSIAGLADRENIKPHSIRHAFATRMMNNGADIKTIQASLGHSDPVTTMTYLHAAEQPAQAMRTLAGFKGEGEATSASGGAASSPALPVRHTERVRVVSRLSRRR